MRLKLVQPWGDYPAGASIEPPEWLAQRLIDKGIAVAEKEPVEAAVIAAEETAVEPEPMTHKRPYKRRQKQVNP